MFNMVHIILHFSANNTPPESVPEGVQDAYLTAESLRRGLVCNISKTSASFPSQFPNMRKHMKAWGHALYFPTCILYIQAKKIASLLDQLFMVRTISQPWAYDFICKMLSQSKAVTVNNSLFCVCDKVLSHHPSVLSIRYKKFPIKVQLTVSLIIYKVDRRQRLILQAEEESNQDNNCSPKTNPDMPGMCEFGFMENSAGLLLEHLQIIIIEVVVSLFS